MVAVRGVKKGGRGSQRGILKCETLSSENKGKRRKPGVDVDRSRPITNGVFERGQGERQGDVKRGEGERQFGEKAP